MRELGRFLGVTMIAMGLGACGITARDGSITQSQTAPPPATPKQKATADARSPDAATLADFNRRLDAYVKLQRGVEKKTPDLKETNNPAEITVAQEVLASTIRNTRTNAKQGDIFAPQVAAMFRRLLAPELKGAGGRETRQTIADDAPDAKVNLKINATYQEADGDTSVSTVPPNVLATLPQLPMDVEYRFVGRHLILRDVDANIIVDYIPNAIR